MNKLLFTILIVWFSFTTELGAEVKLIEQSEHNKGHVISVWCIDGYKYITVRASATSIKSGISIIQVMESVYYKNPPQPGTCNNK